MNVVDVLEQWLDIQNVMSALLLMYLVRGAY